MRYLLSSEDIRAVKSACTKLTHLTFDLDRKTSDLDSELETHAEIIEELSSWHSLSKLQIYYDLGIASLIEVAQAHASLYSDGEDSSSEDSDAEGQSSQPKFDRLTKKELMHPRPSNIKVIQVYLPRLWRAIYGGRSFGARALDVKFGEWERKSASSPWVGGNERTYRTHWMVTPRERDDQPDECAMRRYGTGLFPPEEDADY